MHGRHHLACSIDKLSNCNTFIFQSFIIMVVLFSKLCVCIFLVFFCYLCFDSLLSFLKVVVKSKTINKEIVYFKTIKLFFIFNHFYREGFSFFWCQAYRHSLFENTNFWEDNFNFSTHFINKVELQDEVAEELLSFAFCEFGLVVIDGICFDDLHFVDDNFLTEITLTAFVVNLMLNFVSGEVRRFPVYNISKLHES